MQKKKKNLILRVQKDQGYGGQRQTEKQVQNEGDERCENCMQLNRTLSSKRQSSNNRQCLSLRI